jgi:hypothetical protein
MNSALRILGVGLAAAIAAGPASAADWWLVSGVPSQPTAIFADVDSLSLKGGHAEMKVLRIDRVGRAIETVQQIQCDKASTAAEEEDVRQFACASEAERDQHGLILASMSPVLVARMIFTTELTAEADKKTEPRT